MKLFYSLKNKFSNKDRNLKFLTLAFSIIAFNILQEILYGERRVSLYGGVLSLLLLVISYLFFYKQNYYLKAIVKNSKKVSQGDLDIDDIIINKNNDFKIIAQSLNDMKANLLFYIENTKRNIIMLSETTGILTGGIDNSSAGNEEITASISEIAKKSKEQFNLVNTTAINIDSIFENILNIKENMNEVIKLSKESNLKSITGKELIEKFEDNLHKISESINDTRDFFESMRENVSNISKVTDLIMGISNRLTILSFNASIEAVKNGEAGKGFAVVAEEMKKLANLSKTELEKIKIIVNDLVIDSENIEIKMEENSGNINKGLVSFNLSKEMFNDISIYNKDILDKVSHIIDLSSGIYLLTDKTSQMSEAVKNGSAQISYATREISEVITENTKELLGLNGIAQNLNEFIDNIGSLTSIFNCGIKPVNKNALKKLKIKVFTFSMEKNDFWTTVSQGALYAKKELEKKNTEVSIVTIPISLKDLEQMKKTYMDEIRRAIEEKVDGICMPGLWEELSPLIDRAKTRGIEVILYNSDIEKNNSRVMVYKQNAYESGRLASDILSKKLIGKNKKILIIKDNTRIIDMDRRIDGFMEGLKNHKNLKLLDSFVTSSTNSESLSKFKTYIRNNENSIDGILCNSTLKLDLAKIVEELGIKNKEFLVFDIGHEVCEYIKKNIITSAIGQDPFGQGYSPIIYMYNYLVTKQKPEELVWSRLNIVDTENVNRILN